MGPTHTRGVGTRWDVNVHDELAEAVDIYAHAGGWDVTRSCELAAAVDATGC